MKCNKNLKIDSKNNKCTKTVQTKTEECSAFVPFYPNIKLLAFICRGAPGNTGKYMLYVYIK